VNKPVVLGSIGDLIWKDLDNDGVQDANEVGVAGVTVELYDNATPNTPIKTTVTGTNGEYTFTDLASGAYFVKISVPANMTISMELSTKQNQGGDDATDNDFDATGKSDVVTIDTTDPTKTDITTVDGAIVNKALGSLGDLIWKDTNNDGIQNNSEAGVAGVVVELYDNATNTLLKKDTTDASGNYLFTNLTSGAYYVKFAVPANMPTMELSTKQNQGGDDATDNDFDATGKSDVVTIDITDPTKKDITTVDGAIVNKPVVLGSIGDLIWKDTNNDGIQDATELGVQNVIVELYNADINGKPTGAVLAKDTTGLDGIYTFTNLASGSYVVKIVASSIMAGMEISVKQNQGGNDDKDNDFDKTSGLSPRVVIDVTDPTKKDITNVDGAITNTPTELGSLGDFIWKDLNDNGLQDNGEAGVSGIVLALYNADPWGKPSGAILKKDTTGNDGKYLFTGLTGGRYVVVMDTTTIMNTMELSKKQDTGANDAVDNDFNAITAYSAAVLVDPTDPTKKDITTVDGAIINKPVGSIGDYVWMDMNNDGIQDAGEPFVSGVILELYDAANLITPIAKDTTDSSGKYLFANLSTGNYVVKALSSSFPTGKFVTKVDNTADDKDSDFNPTTYQSPVIVLTPSNTGGDPLKKDNVTIDLGLYTPNPNCPVKICAPVKVTKVK
jgi:hypothetical protein